MKYFILSGEASGDLYGARLAAALKNEDATAEMQGWGGDLMAGEGVQILKHYRELAFMGFAEVVKNLPAIWRNFRKVRRQIVDFQPDVLILIDYPGFNLRMAAWAKKKGIRVFYYISPQLWAWHTSRAKIIRETVERMFVIFPFEVDFYKKHSVEAIFCGHPLLDLIPPGQVAADFFEKNNLTRDKAIIALLPGSRRQEIARMLPKMLAASAHFPECRFVVAGAPSVERAFYEPLLTGYGSVALLENQTYLLLQHAHAALVTSGTATLETALFQVPQVVCYEGGRWSYALAKRLVNRDLKYIAIVNLIAGTSVVEELIQEDFTEENLRDCLSALLTGSKRTTQLQHYKNLRAQLGPPGAAERAAGLMVAFLRNNG